MMEANNHPWQLVGLDGQSAALRSQPLASNDQAAVSPPAAALTGIMPPLGELPPPRPQPSEPSQPPQPPQQPPQQPRPSGPQQPPQQPRPQPPQPPRPQPPRPQPPQPPRPQPPQPPRPQPPRPQPQPPQPPRPQPPRPQPQPPTVLYPELGPLPPLGIPLAPGQTPGRGACLGPASSSYTPAIEALIRQELSLWLAWMKLAQRTTIWRSALSSFAGEHLARARRLVSAYRYITGYTYWPTSISDISSAANFDAELERLYQNTWQLENDYRAAASQVNDRCLTALYQLLTEQIGNQISQIASILRYYRYY